MISSTFQKIWTVFMGLLVAFFTVSACVYGRHAFLGFPNASGDPEGIARARFAAGIITVILSVFAILFVVMLVRGIKRLKHDRHA